MHAYGPNEAQPGFILVPTFNGQAAIAVSAILEISDLERTESRPDRGAVVRYQAANGEVYHETTTARVEEIATALKQVSWTAAAQPPQPIVQKVTWHEADRCWRDVVTGVRVELP